MGDLIETMLRDGFEVFRRDDRQQLAVTQRLETSVDKLHEAIKLFVTDVSGSRSIRPRAGAPPRSWCSRPISSTSATSSTRASSSSPTRRSACSCASRARAGLRSRPCTRMSWATCGWRSGCSSRRRRDRPPADRRKGRGPRRRAPSAENHLARLRAGRPENIDSSALHLDILRDLKRIHSHICAIAYPLLDEAGQLYRSRLKRVERRALQEEVLPAPRPPRSAARATRTGSSGGRCRRSAAIPPDARSLIRRPASTSGTPLPAGRLVPGGSLRRPARRRPCRPYRSLPELTACGGTLRNPPSPLACIWKPSKPGAFFKAVQDTFPEIEPITQQGVQLVIGPDSSPQPHASAPSDELSAEATRERPLLLQVSEQMFTINALRPYPGWEDLKAELQQVWPLVLEIIKPEAITRIGMRYINRIHRQDIA